MFKRTQVASDNSAQPSAQPAARSYDLLTALDVADADPSATSCEKRRYAAIRADAVASGAIAMLFAIVLIAPSAIAAGPMHGLPSCLNQPDKNGSRPGC